MIVSLKAYGEMLAICMHIISNECVGSGYLSMLVMQVFLSLITMLTIV